VKRTRTSQTRYPALASKRVVEGLEGGSRLSLSSALSSSPELSDRVQSLKGIS
jgi:hypothetical protein